MDGFDLLARRKRARLSQVDVAKAMGVSRQRISQFERRDMVSLELIERYDRAVAVLVEQGRGA